MQIATCGSSMPELLTPAMPTGESVQTLCTGTTLADLIVTGDHFNWFNVETDGSGLSASTPLVDKHITSPVSGSFPVNQSAWRCNLLGHQIAHEVTVEGWLSPAQTD
jgi:hypothetical protein